MRSLWKYRINCVSEAVTMCKNVVAVEIVRKMDLALNLLKDSQNPQSHSVILLSIAFRLSLVTLNAARFCLRFWGRREMSEFGNDANLTNCRVSSVQLLVLKTSQATTWQIFVRLPKCPLMPLRSTTVVWILRCRKCLTTPRASRCQVCYAKILMSLRWSREEEFFCLKKCKKMRWINVNTLFSRNTWWRTS
jgi:hypothetical protein